MGFIILFVFNLILASLCLIAALALIAKQVAEGFDSGAILLLFFACTGFSVAVYFTYRQYRAYINALDGAQQEGEEANCYVIWDYDEEEWKQLLDKRIQGKLWFSALLAVIVFVGILGPTIASEGDPLFLGLLIVLPAATFGAMFFYQSAKRKRLEAFGDKRLYFYPSSIKFADELLVFQTFGINFLNMLYMEEQHLFVVILRVQHNRELVNQRHLFPVPLTVSPERVRALLAKYKEVFAIS